MRRRVEAVGFPPPPPLVDVNQQDYSTQTTAALGLQVRVPGQLDRKIGLGVQLDDWTAPEFWWLRKGIRGYAGDARGGVAGQFTFFAIQCLPGSLLVVERVLVCAPNAAQYVSYGIQAAQPAAAAAAAGTPMDSRAFGQGAAARWVFSNNAAVTGPVVSTRMYLPAGVTVQFEPNAVVTNGNWFSVISAVVNTELAVTVYYRERPLLPSEE